MTTNAIEYINFDKLEKDTAYSDDFYTYILKKHQNRIIIHVLSRKPTIIKARPIIIQFPDTIDYAIDFTDCFLNHRVLRDISALSSIYSSKIISTEKMFFNCWNLVDISPLSTWNVSDIYDMEGMFFLCKKLRDLLPLSMWKVSDECTMRGFYAPFGNRMGEYRLGPVIDLIKINPSTVILPDWLKQINNRFV